MKILIIGSFQWEIYEKAIYERLIERGFETYKFSWSPYFSGNRNIISDVYNRFQNKYTIGPIIHKINHDLYDYCKELKPDLVFIYRGTHILPETLERIKRNGSTIFGYNNDDPFSNHYPKYFWRHYINSIPIYDHIFVYRQKNIIEHIENGNPNVSLLRSYYLKERNYNIPNPDNQQYVTDVSFIGHFENDGRDEYIKLLAESNINCKVLCAAAGWEKSKYYSHLNNICGEIRYERDDYNLAMNSTKIALVFLSKINNDSYTRRCFEIPATKTFMLSEYTDDLSKMYKEGVEAEYFRDKIELLEKVKYYLKNEDVMEEIAINGYKRLLKDGHEVSDRIDQILEQYRIVLGRRII